MSEKEALSKLLSKNCLGLQELQAFHRELDQAKHFDQDIFRNIAYLTGEIGELVSVIRVLRKTDDFSKNREWHMAIR